MTKSLSSKKLESFVIDNNVKRVALIVIFEKVLKGYITIVQERYPMLKYFKVGALKSLPGAKSQYVRHGRNLKDPTTRTQPSYVDPGTGGKIR